MSESRMSDRLRVIIGERYVLPALRSGDGKFTLRVREILDELEGKELPRGRVPIVCQVLQSKKLLKQHGLVIDRVDGPPSKQSSTVVVHYRLAQGVRSDVRPIPNEEDPLLELRGVLRGAIREGAAAFLRELRRDKEAEPDKENAA